MVASFTPAVERNATPAGRVTSAVAVVCCGGGTGVGGGGGTAAPVTVGGAVFADGGGTNSFGCGGSDGNGGGGATGAAVGGVARTSDVAPTVAVGAGVVLASLATSGLRSGTAGAGSGAGTFCD
jgi:hypothetical protein